MKRIKAACLLQTICFQTKDVCPSAYSRQEIEREYEAYKERMTRMGTKFQILEESTLPDGSILVKLKKQYNQQAIGDYFDEQAG